MALTEILQSLRRRYGATWGTLCSKSPGPDGIHPWVLNEIKWEIMSSVTRIYNRYLKTANIPEDCEVINIFWYNPRSLFYVISKNNKHLHGWANREMVNCNLFYSYNWDIMKACLGHEISKCVWSSFKKWEIYHTDERYSRYSKWLIVKAKADNKTKVNLVI